jgi:hypothetical protein
MEPRLIRIEDTLGEMRETMARNTALLGVNTALLDDHIKRTELLEKQVAGLATEARILRWAAVVFAVAAAVIQIIRT